MTQDEQQQVNAMRAFFERQCGLFAVLLLVSGSVLAEPYWVKTDAPVEHKRTLIVDKPCGRADLDGCANRESGTIELRRGMDATLHWCTLNHEKKHLAGYSHPGAYRGLAKDCGNGETF